MVYLLLNVLFVFFSGQKIGHPGGVGRLQMAAGNDLEVYWKVYTQHNRGHIGAHMERYKIGVVTDEDMATITANTSYDDSIYADNPDPYPGKDHIM